MGTYKKIYAISDIHGYPEGLEKANELATIETPLFVLGDLFDHIYGNEIQIVDTLVDLLESKRGYIITGNHDEVLYLIFFRFHNDQTIIEELNHPGFSTVTATLRTIFSDQFYERYEFIRVRLLNSPDSMKLKIDEYYSSVINLVKELEFDETYEKIKYLFEASRIYHEVQVADKLLLLTHSGNMYKPYGIEVLLADYQLDSKYDYGIMGHITTPYLKNSLINSGSTLKMNNFILKPVFKEISIRGNYVYNKHSKTLMIDDGTHHNLVTIEVE